MLGDMTSDIEKAPSAQSDAGDKIGMPVPRILGFRAKQLPLSGGTVLRWAVLMIGFSVAEVNVAPAVPISLVEKFGSREKLAVETATGWSVDEISESVSQIPGMAMINLFLRLERNLISDATPGPMAAEGIPVGPGSRWGNPLARDPFTK
jgi:hypothetical protein